MNSPNKIAIELVGRYKNEVYNALSGMTDAAAKKCSLIAVDEILKILDAELGDPVEHWQQVIQEINKL